MTADPSTSKELCPGCGKPFPQECDWCSDDIPRPPPKCTGAPARIYLVVGDIEMDCKWDDLAGVTWCTDRQYDPDIEYVRADLQPTHEPKARPSGLAEMMDYAARQISEWPADVRAAMGIEEVWTTINDGGSRNGRPNLDVLSDRQSVADDKRYFLVPASAPPPPVGEGEVHPSTREQQEGLLNPVEQVMFRAGLLSCRAYMAAFVESGGDKVIADSIRANWWPCLGEDPGPPRKNTFQELTVGEYGEPGFRVKTREEVSPSIEALPVALGFLIHKCGWSDEKCSALTKEPAPRLCGCDAPYREGYECMNEFNSADVKCRRLGEEVRRED